MTIVGCFPITMNIMTIVNIIVLVVPAIGAIVFAEHWIIPKLGGTRCWASYKGLKINYAGLIAWLISLAFVSYMTITGTIHSYFLFLPTYLIAMARYIVLALCMGAKDDYSVQVEEERKVMEELEKIQEEEDEEKEVYVSKNPGLQKFIARASYVVLAVFAIFTVCVFLGNVSVAQWKSYSFPITIVYFVLGGLATWLKYGYAEKQ